VRKKKRKINLVVSAMGIELAVVRVVDMD